jgi:hypothetical protein
MTDYITVARGLVELKTLGDRIGKATNELVPIHVFVGETLPPGYKSKEEFKDAAGTGKQRVTDLIERRKALKSAIVRSNAVTQVSINGKSMSVAEAIERKLSIGLDKTLLNTLKKHFSASSKRVDEINEQVRVRLDSHLKEFFGRDKKPDEDQQAAITKPFMATNEAHLLDPLDLRPLIDTMDEEITKFEQEVDIVLSESNAKTFLTDL